MRNVLRRLDEVVRDYATEAGWRPTGYRVYARVNEDWWYVHLLITADSFPGGDGSGRWFHFDDYLRAALKKDYELFPSISVALQTNAEVAEGGGYEVPDSYVPMEYLVVRPAAV